MAEKPEAAQNATARAAETAGPQAGSAASKAAETAAKSEGNPVFRMMGLPKFRAKLPSRNWMIFLGVTGSFAAAVYYDKRETKRVQKHWCDVVAPLALETLPSNTMPRRLTIYLQAPPADGLRNAREHFYDYVKPVLVAAAMDWDVVEGRKEGDLRWGTAEKIRGIRRRAGEAPLLEDEESKVAVEEMRRAGGTRDEEGVKGDVVIGRHAWKEYIRGLHEGWLGPVLAPVEPPQADDAPEQRTHVDGSPSIGDAAVSAAANLAAPDVASAAAAAAAAPAPLDAATTPDDASPTAPTPAPEPAKQDETPKPKPAKPGPYISTLDYQSATPSASLPQTLGPAAVVPFPHILGFWNFPFRLWRFLHRRQLADDVGRRTAAAVLGLHRDFRPQDLDALAHEEPEWAKSVRKRERVDGVESVWQDDVVTDERIASRLRVFEIDDDDDAAAAAAAREQ